LATGNKHKIAYLLVDTLTFPIEKLFYFVEKRLGKKRIAKKGESERY